MCREWDEVREFDTVLVANRGEIAVRVIDTLRRIGLRSIAVFSEADRDARHVAVADAAVHLGSGRAADSYLNVQRVLDAALRTGAQAIHPGYGFLSENAEFATACEHAGVVFIGPPPAAIEAMGDKIRAKRAVRSAGVPVVPGRSDPGMTDEDIAASAAEIGFPVLLKPSAGGGGKGMRTVRGPDELPAAVAAARREAGASFGDDTLFVERFVDHPRHVEVQILADAHGGVLHLGERECSLQRRHQKIVEEAPSPLLDESTRQRIGQAAVDAARAVDYRGAGTVEFIVSADRPDEFFFMEMNTRLQVEHPVTEEVTTVSGSRGVDLVAEQVRVASGRPLSFEQHQLGMDGHAVEARVYAEDPARDFLPTGGEVLGLHEPSGQGVRVDSGIVRGTRIGSDYDPMLSKIIAWAPERGEALRRLDAALAETAVLGVHTNIGFLRHLIAHPDVRSGVLDTGLVERELTDLVADSGAVPKQVLVAAAMAGLLAAEPAGPVVNRWSVPDGWRLGETAWSTWRFTTGGDEVQVRVRGRAHEAEVAVGAEVHPACAQLDGDLLTVTWGGRTERYRFRRRAGVDWVSAGGRCWALAEQQLLTDPAGAGGRSDGVVTSPMPGTVLVVDVEAGQHVSSGQRLFVVEAMKMEHNVIAPTDGVVDDVHARAGQPVGLDEPLAVLTAAQEG